MFIVMQDAEKKLLKINILLNTGHLVWNKIYFQIHKINIVIKYGENGDVETNKSINNGNE